MSLGASVRNQALHLARVPAGVAGPGDFEVRESEVPRPAEGQLLVRSEFVGLDAALRLIVRDSSDFLFRVRPGDLVHGSVAGTVVESRHPDYRAGDAVVGSLGVQRYALSDGRGLERCDTGVAPLSSWLGPMGVSGLTAYFAMFDACKPQPGQTVLVNGAAGAVGSIAGQLARLAGARTLGLTSSAEKCGWLVEELGYDVALDYRAPDFRAQLERAAPERLDVIFDNVGGPVLDESLRLIAMRGCVLLCGSTSQYSAEHMSGPANYIWLGTMRARMQGFVVFDYADRYAEGRRRLAAFAKAGRIRLPEHIVDGDIRDFPSAFQRLYRGENKGKMVLRLPA
jgi:NADPH-dependent curcumin reductase CurA